MKKGKFEDRRPKFEEWSFSVYKRFIPSLIWIIAIAILSGYPGNKIPETPFLNFDKLVHVGIYFVLSIAICFAFINEKKLLSQQTKLRVWIICFGIFYGGFMEILQHYIFINRSGSWYDFFANTIGATIGVFFYPFVIKLLPFKR